MHHSPSDIFSVSVHKEATNEKKFDENAQEEPFCDVFGLVLLTPVLGIVGLQLSPAVADVSTCGFQDS